MMYPVNKEALFPPIPLIKGEVKVKALQSPCQRKYLEEGSASIIK